MDSNIKIHQAPITYEGKWSKKHQGIFVFAFLLALTEVNDTLGEHYFGGMGAFKPIFKFMVLIYRDLLNIP